MSESSKHRSDPQNTVVYRGEAIVWTDRMLTALGNGVQRGKWHTKHANNSTFRFIDGFVRRRLRSILRKYQKKKGGTGKNVLDHMAWPNTFFARLGLLTIDEAYVGASKSRC